MTVFICVYLYNIQLQKLACKYHTFATSLEDVLVGTRCLLEPLIPCRHIIKSQSKNIHQTHSFRSKRGCTAGWCISKSAAPAMSSRKVIAKHTKMGKQSARSQTSSTSSSTKIHGNENLRKDGTGLNVIGRSLTPMLSEKKKKKTPKGTENDTGCSLVPIVKKKSRNKTPAEVTDGDVLLAPTSKKKTKKKLVLEKAVRETATETLLAQRSKKKKRLTIQTEAGKKEKNPFKLYPLAIQEQLEKGEKSWREEADAFDGVNFVDEVWDIKPRQLKKMAKAWGAAMARHGEISEALASWEPKDDEEHGAWIQATMHKTQIFSHFPYQFQTDFKIDLLKRVEKQEEASQLTNIQKANEIEKLQEASECESERCIFADIISSAGFDTVEDMEEIDPFYHKCLRDMTAIDIEELAQITTAVVVSS